jgi:hypothetical protein
MATGKSPWKHVFYSPFYSRKRSPVSLAPAEFFLGLELQAVKYKYNGPQRDGQDSGLDFLKVFVSIISPHHNHTMHQ